MLQFPILEKTFLLLTQLMHSLPTHSHKAFPYSQMLPFNYSIWKHRSHFWYLLFPHLMPWLIYYPIPSILPIIPLSAPNLLLQHEFQVTIVLSRFPEFPPSLPSGHTASLLVLTILHASSCLCAFAYAVPSPWNIHCSVLCLVNLTHPSDHSAEFLITLTKAGTFFELSSSTEFFSLETFITVAILHSYTLMNVCLPHRPWESEGHEWFLILPPVHSSEKTFNTWLLNEWIEIVSVIQVSSSQEEEILSASVIRGARNPQIPRPSFWGFHS